MNQIGESLLEKLMRERVDDARQALSSKCGTVTACNCIGPQPGMPRCPCAMRNVIKRDGRWIQIEQDLGPAT